MHSTKLRIMVFPTFKVTYTAQIYCWLYNSYTLHKQLNKNFQEPNWSFCFILKSKFILFYLLSITLICCHSLYHFLPFTVTRFLSRCHSLLFVVNCYQSLYYSLSLVVIRCTNHYHLLSLVVICCHSLHHLLSLVVIRCFTRLSFYKQSRESPK